MRRKRLSSARNDINQQFGDGCVDTAIVRVYDTEGTSLEMEVIPKNDGLLVNICPGKHDGGELIVLTRQQELLVLEQLAERLGYRLVKRGKH
jgi:hypothetical protein